MLASMAEREQNRREASMKYRKFGGSDKFRNKNTVFIIMGKNFFVSLQHD